MSEHDTGYDNCFKMTMGNSNLNSLHCLKKVNVSRNTLDQKTLRGMITRDQIMIQMSSEFLIFDKCLEKINLKRKEKKSYNAINDALPILSKRINGMWNDMYLLFNVEEEFVPDYINWSSNCNIARMTASTSDEFNDFDDVELQCLPRNSKNMTDENVNILFSTSDFVKILQTTTFVDKTLLIKEVFKSHEFRGLVTAPRKFGKSTNISMLKYFLEIQVDSMGRPLTDAEDHEAINDTSNYALFRGLKITQHEIIMKQHFGKYPVLHVNFKRVNTRSFNKVVLSCKDIVHESFKQHDYLKYSVVLDAAQRKKCELWSHDVNYKKIKKAYVDSGLSTLSKCLSTHFNKPCFALVEGHDALIMPMVISNSWFNGSKRIFCFVRRMLSFLKCGETVGRAFVTGKSAMASTGTLPPCMKVYRFSDCHEYTDYYGFTPTELEHIFKKPEFTHMLMMKKEVQDYYGGYTKEDRVTKKKKHIYCMWSVLSVLKRNILDNYWKEFGSIYCAFKIEPIHSKIQCLLRGETITIEQYDTTKCIVFPEIFANPKKPESMNFFLNFLVDVGYLTCISQPTYTQNTKTDNNRNLLCIRIPNMEIKRDIEDKLKVLS